MKTQEKIYKIEAQYIPDTHHTLIFIEVKYIIVEERTADTVF